MVVEKSVFEQVLNEKILFIDGAMGTMIQAYKFDEADYRGQRFAVWLLKTRRP